MSSIITYKIMQAIIRISRQSIKNKLLGLCAIALLQKNPNEYIAKKMHRGCLVFLLITVALFPISQLHGQSSAKIPGLKKDLIIARNDSDRVDALTGLCFNYADVNHDTALLYGAQAMKLANRINYTKGIADSYNNMGWVYYTLSNMKKAEEYFITSMNLFKKTGNKNYIKIPLSNLGILYMDQTEYARSLNCYMQVLRYEDQAVNSKDFTTLVNKAATLHNIGRLYNLLKKPEEAKKYFLQALDISRLAHSDPHIGENLMSIGNTYQSADDPQQALKYYEESLQFLEKAADNYRIGLTHENMGTSRMALKNYSEAIKQYKLAKAYYLIMNSKTDMFYICIGLAEVYGAVKDSLNEITQLNEGLLHATQLDNKNFQQQVLSGLSDFYKEHNDFKNAFVYLDSSYKIKDSLFTREKQNELVKLQTQFETERKEEQIKLLTKERLLAVTTLQKNKTYQYAAYIIIGLLVLIGFLIINRYRTVQRAKRFMEINQIRNNIARDLHDDIGSTLTSINILSEVALQQAAEANSSTRNIQKIKDRSAGIMDRMNDIVWAINPANDALDKILLRMKEFSNELCEENGIQCNFSEQGEINTISLSLKQRSDLYLIFKEALHNAVKHSEATTIQISVKGAPGNLYFSIVDNGRGFDTNDRYTGNGLKNMAGRAAEIQAVFATQSVAGNGTTITLDIPIT